MDFVMGSAAGRSGEGDDHNNAFNSEMPKKSSHRHTTSQIHRLEAFYKDCPHPDEIQRNDLGRELGLEPKQIKFWFQNKRTQMKTLSERMDNNVLRVENERMQCENFAIKEALKSINCPSCGSPAFGNEERELTLQKLLQENAHLRQEHEKATKLLASYIGRPVTPQMEGVGPSAMALGCSPSWDDLSLRIGSPPEVDFRSGLMISIPNDDDNDDDDNTRMLGKQEMMDKAMMKESATSAMEELVRLMRVNEPLWIKSEGGEEEDGFFVLNPDSYERIFPRAHHFKTFNVRVESSKASRIVGMSALELVDIFLDSDKWVSLFPTIVTKAQTMKVIESGSSGSRNGALQLMYEEMHILTPVVPPREFLFLRYCYQMDIGTWVIADVSFNSLEDNDVSYCGSCWRLPSGCMIHQLPNGSSKVTWVEHVEVDGKILTHRLYRHLVYSNVAYGAERWVVTLERMCERIIACSLPHNIPADEAGGELSSGEGRKRVMKVGERMMKRFSGGLNMGGGGQMGEMNNSGTGIKVCVRKNVQREHPDGMVLTAATSVWLPLPLHHVFDFLRDQNRRLQWDVLSNGNAVQEIGRISTGTHPGNYIAIIRPLIPTENNIVIVQETYVEPMGCLVVYAPVDISAMNVVTTGEESAAAVPVLPSGFVVTADSSAGASGGSSSGGSILTVAFQILACSPSAMRRLNMESVASVNNLITTTIHKIKLALNC